MTREARAGIGAALLAVVCAGCTVPWLGGRSGPAAGTKDDIALRFGRDSAFASAPAPAPAPGPAPAAAGGAVAASPASAHRLKVGDSVIVMLRTPPTEQQFEMMIDEKGELKLPLLDPMHAEGLTMSELERRIEKTYVDQKVYRYVSANVLVPSRSYFVRGEIRQPGRYPLLGGVTLLQAIAAAGGYTEFANGRKVQVVRGSTTQTVDAKDFEKNPEKDIELQNGDVVIVPRTWY
jgi:polysaccharide export outer membrane protein